MANLTFTDLQNETFAHTGLDSSDSTNLTNVKRWINYVQQDLYARWPWPWASGRETIVTVPDKTGTVTVANGGSNLTEVTLALVSTDVGSFIQFNGANDLYLVSAVAAPFVSFTPAYLGTSATVSCIVRKFFYSLSSTADEVLDVRNWNTPIKLINCDFRTIDLINPLVQSTSPAYGYMMFGTDSSGNQVFTPYPFPNDARLFEFRVKKRPTDMSGGTDAPSVPNKYAHILSWGAIAIGFAYLRKLEEAQAWNLKVEARIDQMKKEYRQSGDYQPVLSSIDSVSRSRWIQFPSSYPVIQG